MQKLIVLDRDGVINEDSDAFVKNAEEWIEYPTSIQAIARLTRAGYTVAVATNQSGIARGHFGPRELDQMHAQMMQLVKEAGGDIAHIAYCPHGPDDGCDCRKPEPGLLHQIQDALQIPDFEGAWMLGDSLRDLVAGQKAGCRAALVMTGKGQKTLADGEGLKDVLVVANLADFTNRLLDGELNHAMSDGEPGKSQRRCVSCEAAAESYL